MTLGATEEHDLVPHSAAHKGVDSAIGVYLRLSAKANYTTVNRRVLCRHGVCSRRVPWQTTDVNKHYATELVADDLVVGAVV